MPALSVALVVMLGATANLAEQTRFLRAVAIAQEGKLGAASEELELLARKGGALADRSAYEAGLLFERRGALRKAGDLFGAVSTRSFFFAEARMARARVLRLHGDFDRAAAALAPLTSSPVKAVRRKALIELSIIAELDRDERGRRDALNRLALARAPWLGGAPALALIAGSFDPLIRRNECLDARKVARRASPELSCSNRLLDAEAAACLGKDVAVDLRRIIRDCPQPELASRAWMTLGVLQARDGKAKFASVSFRKVAKVNPTSALAAEALFAAFWVEWKTAPSRTTDRALVRLQALPVELSTQDRARIGYWRSRVASTRGDLALEAKLLAEVATLHPATWYAHLARERLLTLDVSRASSVDLALIIPTHTDASNEREAFDRLAPGLTALQLGLDDATAELMSLARREPSLASNRLVVEALNAVGATEDAYRFSRAVLREQPGARQDATVWQTAFPDNFGELLSANADESKVSPDLLHGLVREESSFIPTARSHCGARGLMQLMPVTARALAVEKGSPLEHLDELYQPQRNVELGSRYLGQLLKRFDGNRAAAAAAYNGGPTRVAGWLKLPSAAEPIEWVEEIPLHETRNYVKDVLASADIYRHRLASAPRAAGSAAAQR